MPFYTYILKSTSLDTYYYGSTQDLEKRILQHNNGKVRYTKGRRPWRLHYVEAFESRSEAMAREKIFKSIEGYFFLRNNNII